MLLGNFLYDNYQQALNILSETGAELQAYRDIHSLSDMDFERFLEEECTYLARLAKPWVENDIEIAYVEALENMEMARYVGTVPHH